LPLYWPEVQRFWHTSRALAITRLLERFPVPGSVRALSEADFIAEAWDLIGRKVRKQAWLEEFYRIAGNTIGLPVDPDGLTVETIRLQLQRYRSLTELRGQLEATADTMMDESSDYALLKSIPGIGSVHAMVILAEAGDLRRFSHHRQFLKFCGLDLAKCQSGAFRGQERLSKRGNGRLRCAFWMAATIAVRMRENSFRAKYERYIRSAPNDADRKRKALTAVAGKIARVAHAIVKTQKPYRAYFESTVPSGSTPIRRAVEANATS
jgi:transposase